MNHRLLAILIIGWLALAGAGCALMNHGKTENTQTQKKPAPKKETPKKQTQKKQTWSNTREVVLPRQTGSNLDRRVTLNDESSVPEVKQPEPKPPTKKHTETESTKPEKTKQTKKVKTVEPDQTPAEPDRFR